MPDQFERIADYAKNTCQLDDAADIRARGMRRLRRRRTSQAVLGTGAVAVVTGLGAAMALNPSSHAPGRSVATASGPRPSSTLPFITPSGICAGIVRPVNVPTLLDPQAHVLFTRLGGAQLYADYNDPQNPCDGDSYALGLTEQEVLHALRQLGFSALTTATAPSSSTPAGEVMDIRMQSGTSAFQEGVRGLTPSTPLVIVVSTGSAASNS